MRSLRLWLVLLLCTSALCQIFSPRKAYRSDELQLTFVAPGGWTIIDSDRSLGPKDKVLYEVRDEGDSQRSITLGWHDERKQKGAPFVTAYQLMRTVDPTQFDAEPISDKINTVWIGGREFARADFRTKEQSPKFLSILTGNVQGNVYQFSIRSDRKEDLDSLVEMASEHNLFDPAWASPEVEGKPFVPAKRVLLKESDTNSFLIKKKSPRYPPTALAQRIQGVVALHALIGPDGNPKYIWLRMGPPELVAASIEALSQWAYKPYLVNGEPVEVEEEVVMRYTIN